MPRVDISFSNCSSFWILDSKTLKFCILLSKFPLFNDSSNSDVLYPSFFHPLNLDLYFPISPLSPLRSIIFVGAKILFLRDPDIIPTIQYPKNANKGTANRGRPVIHIIEVSVRWIGRMSFKIGIKSIG